MIQLNDIFHRILTYTIHSKIIKNKTSFYEIGTYLFKKLVALTTLFIYKIFKELIYH